MTHTCPHCGELTHPSHLCRPAIASLLAEEKLAHAEDRDKIERLAAENERLRRELEGESCEGVE